MKADHSTMGEQAAVAAHALTHLTHIESLLADHSAIQELAQSRLGDPFSLLGCHAGAHGLVVRSFQPGALAVDVLAREPGRADEDQPLLASLACIDESGLFAG